MARASSTVASLTSALAESGFGDAVGFNDMEGRIFVCGTLPWREGTQELRPWDAVDDSYGFAYAEENFGCANERTFQHALSLVADRNHINPLHDCLDALPQWDGSGRIGLLFPLFLGAEKTPYNHEVESLFLRAALARAYRPGCKFDSMVVLTGPQGIGKSTLLRHLALEPSFFTDSVTGIGTKQAAEIVQGKWIVELSELSAMRASALETVKAFISRRSDDFRAPYARHVESRPRRFVLTGTTNAKAFLSDTSGNRRFLPVVCGVSRPEASLFEHGAVGLIKQVWAEALFKFRSGLPQTATNLVLPAHVIDEAEAMRREAKIDDPREGLIERWLDGKEPGEYVCVVEAMEEALDVRREFQRRAEQMEVAELLGTMERLSAVPGKHRTERFGVQRVFRVNDADAPSPLPPLPPYKE